MASRFRTQKFRQDALTSTVWAQKYRRIVRSNPATHIIILEPYRAVDIARMLAAVLHVPIAPPEILQMVVNSSGGSRFWLLEIMQFIVDHGIEEFKEAVSDDSDGVGMTLPDVKMPFSTRISLTSTRISGRTVGTLRAKNGSISTSAYTSKLNKLVLCRFGDLSHTAQIVLRTASIVGVTFSAQVLMAVLPKELKATLPESLVSLVDLRWVTTTTDDPSLYEFAHLHSQQLIYELTPTTERGDMHRLIAKY